MLTEFQNSFTIRLRKKFATKRSLKIPPHLKCVATLPCEMWMLKTRNNLKHSYWLTINFNKINWSQQKLLLFHELQWVFKMSFSGLHAIMETPVPLVYGILNNALLHFSPTVNQTLLKIVHILHFCLVDSLLHYAPDFTFSWIAVGVVGRSKICWDKCRSLTLTLKEVDHLVRPVRWELSWSKMITHQRPDVWQAATVVIVAHHDNMLHWLTLTPGSTNSKLM